MPTGVLWSPCTRWEPVTQPLMPMLQLYGLMTLVQVPLTSSHASIVPWICDQPVVVAMITWVAEPSPAMSSGRGRRTGAVGVAPQPPPGTVDAPADAEPGRPASPATDSAAAPPAARS